MTITSYLDCDPFPTAIILSRAARGQLPLSAISRLAASLRWETGECPQKMTPHSILNRLICRQLPLYMTSSHIYCWICSSLPGTVNISADSKPEREEFVCLSERHFTNVPSLSVTA